MSRITQDICELLRIQNKDRSRREQALNNGHEQTNPCSPNINEPQAYKVQQCFETPANPPAGENPLDSVATPARRVILAGGSGFLGGLLARYLIERDWIVVILTRAKVKQESNLSGNRENLPTQTPDLDGYDSITRSSVKGDSAPRQAGSLSYVEWDGRTLGGWTSALDGADVVINLAGRSVNCRYHARNRRLMMDSRINPTRVLGEAIGNCDVPPRVWLNFSTATIYKHTFGEPWDEAGEIGASPAARDAFSIEVATAWERAFNEAGTPQTRKVALRSAMVFGLSNDANNVFRVLRRLVRLGLGGRMGSGRQWVSWIHERDFCRTIEFIIGHDNLIGPVNLAAPNPISNSDMMRTFRQALRMPLGLPAAEWMLELGAFFLRTETELIIKSRRVVAGRLRNSGFRFEFEKLDDALRDLERRLHAT